MKGGSNHEAARFVGVPGSQSVNFSDLHAADILQAPVITQLVGSVRRNAEYQSWVAEQEKMWRELEDAADTVARCDWCGRRYFGDEFCLGCGAPT